MSAFFEETALWERPQWEQFFYTDHDWFQGEPIRLWKARCLNDIAHEYKGMIPIWVTEKDQYIPLPFMNPPHLKNAWKMCVNNMVAAAQDHFTTPHNTTVMDEWTGDAVIKQQQEAAEQLIYWFKSSSYLLQEFCRRRGTYPALPEPLRVYIDKLLLSGEVKTRRGLTGTSDDLNYCNLIGFYISEIYKKWYNRASK